MTFLFAHLSDPHVGPLPTPRWRDLAGKRLTGYWNWRTSRKTIHNMEVLAAIRDDIVAHRPDHIALTGDLVNIGLAAEFPLAQRLLDGLGDGTQVSVIPGNHDAYVTGSLDAMTRVFSPCMTGDDGVTGFPYLRTRGGIAFVGVSSGIPTAPFFASGAVGPDQMRRLETLLADLRLRNIPVVVLIHHPPHRAGARFGRGLRDAGALEHLLARHGADLVVHGHNHRFSVARLRGPA
ncbi:MAG TPA: metallophosphoesterase, partial [Beijerinckiaceae bacterium]|nr:metallophosphoesterase [Beijerinckiaceae bacterium]